MMSKTSMSVDLSAIVSNYHKTMLEGLGGRLPIDGRKA